MVLSSKPAGFWRWVPTFSLYQISWNRDLFVSKLLWACACSNRSLTNFFLSSDVSNWRDIKQIGSCDARVCKNSQTLARVQEGGKGEKKGREILIENLRNEIFLSFTMQHRLRFLCCTHILCRQHSERNPVNCLSEPPRSGRDLWGQANKNISYAKHKLPTAFWWMGYVLNQISRLQSVSVSSSKGSLTSTLHSTCPACYAITSDSIAIIRHF